MKIRQIARRDIQSVLLKLSAELLFLAEAYAEAAQSSDIGELYAELSEAEDDINSLQCTAIMNTQRIRTEYAETLA